MPGTNRIGLSSFKRDDTIYSARNFSTVSRIYEMNNYVKPATDDKTITHIGRTKS